MNFLSLILANAVRRRSDPESVPPSNAVVPAASGRIGHRARPRRGTIGYISRISRPGQPPRHNRSRSARPTPVGHHQSRPVPIASRFSRPILVNSPRRGETVSLLFSLLSREACRGGFRYVSLLSRAESRGRRNDAWKLVRASTRGPDINYRACGTKSHFPACSPAARGEAQ